MKKHTLEFIEKEFRKDGYTLLSKEYKNNYQKLDYICSNGHKGKIRWNCWQGGHRCRRCYNIKQSSKMVGDRNHQWKGGYFSKNIPTFDVYSDNVSYAEKIRKAYDDENILEIKCTYCGEWFVPKISAIESRIKSLEGKSLGENRLYCSRQCKKECSIYGQKLYPKGYKKTTSREVQPELRQMIFKRDNFTCQKCDKHKNELNVGLHCHHIVSVKQNPIESADVDNCITLCKDCHKFVHSQKGCKYFELRCLDE